MRISRVYPCNVRSQPRCVKEGGRVSHESLFSLGNLAQPTTPWWKYRSCAHSYLEPRTGNKAEALLSDRIMYAVPREGGNSATKRCRLEGKGDYVVFLFLQEKSHFHFLLMYIYIVYIYTSLSYNIWVLWSHTYSSPQKREEETIMIFFHIFVLRLRISSRSIERIKNKNFNFLIL